MVGSLENIDNNQKGGMNVVPPQGLAAAHRESRLTPLSIAGGVGGLAAGALFGAEVGAAALVAAPVALAHNRLQASQQAASELSNLTDLKSFLDPMDGVPPELLGYELWDTDEGAVSDAVRIPFQSQIFYKDKGTKTAIVIMGEQNKVRFSLNASAKVDAYEGLDTRNDTKYFGEIAELKESDSVEGYLAVVPADGAEHFTNEGGRIYLYLTKITNVRPIDALAAKTLTELIKSKIILRIKLKEAGGVSHRLMRGKVGTSRFKVDKGQLLGHVAKIMDGYDKGVEVNLNADVPPRPGRGRDRPPRRRDQPPRRRDQPPARPPIPARTPPPDRPSIPDQLDLTVRATQRLAPRGLNRSLLLHYKKNRREKQLLEGEDYPTMVKNLSDKDVQTYLGVDLDEHLRFLQGGPTWEGLPQTYLQALTNSLDVKKSNASSGGAPRVRFDDVVVRRPSGGGRRSSGKRKNKTRKRRKNSSRRKGKSSKRKKRTTRGK